MVKLKDKPNVENVSQDIQMESSDISSVQESVQPSIKQKSSMNAPFGTKREGGRHALMAENIELGNADKKPSDQRSEIYKRYDEAQKDQQISGNQEQSGDLSESEDVKEKEQIASGESQEEQTEESPSEDKSSPYFKSWKEAEKRMYDATQESAHLRRLQEELSPFIDWKAYQESMTGKRGTEREPVVYPSLELAITNPEEYHKQYRNSLLKDKEFVQALSKEISPGVSQQTELQRLTMNFREEFKSLKGGPEIYEDMVGRLMVIEREKNPKRSINQIYETAKKQFVENLGIKKEIRPERKVIPLEGPTRGKDKVESIQETGLFTTMTPQMERKDYGDYMKFRQKELSKVRGENL